ncbi:MAG TPA: hypothetical protein VMU60_09705 [Syntrophobacteria bacterium]|nr:hypothetical protein [Syntrophobacteria bacterium]
MKSVAITLGERELMRLEAILMDRDERDALLFLKEVVMAKVREKGSSALDPKKGTGLKV